MRSRGSRCRRQRLRHPCTRQQNGSTSYDGEHGEVSRQPLNVGQACCGLGAKGLSMLDAAVVPGNPGSVVDRNDFKFATVVMCVAADQQASAGRVTHEVRSEFGHDHGDSASGGIVELLFQSQPEGCLACFDNLRRARNVDVDMGNHEAAALSAMTMTGESTPNTSRRSNCVNDDAQRRVQEPYFDPCPVALIRNMSDSARVGFASGDGFGLHLWKSGPSHGRSSNCRHEEQCENRRWTLQLAIAAEPMCTVAVEYTQLTFLHTASCGWRAVSLPESGPWESTGRGRRVLRFL